jgi:hypothetical protein
MHKILAEASRTLCLVLFEMQRDILVIRQATCLDLERLMFESKRGTPLSLSQIYL